MFTKQKALLLFVLCSLLLSLQLNAQVKIGDNPTTVNSASLLELETTNKGFVLPRVSLVNINSISPLAAGALVSTLVYNTNISTIGGSGTGIYIWDGSKWNFVTTNLSSTAWLTTGNTGTNYATSFLGTIDNISLRLRTNNIQRLIVDSIGKIGINVSAPAKRLDINASTAGSALTSKYDYLKISNLAIDSANAGGTVFNNNYSQYLVIDTLNHLVGVSSVQNIAGQIMRFGLNTGSYSTTESAIRFNTNNTAALMGNAPNGQPNFINTISGSSFNTGVIFATANNGAPVRTTDQVVLPAGVYKITLRITTSTVLASSNILFFKIIVNNNEYSLQQASFSGATQTAFTVIDDLNLGAASTVDFTTQNSSNFGTNYTFIDKSSPGIGNSYRSLVLIEKLR